MTLTARIEATLLLTSLVLAGASSTFAQAGSTGGSIGKEDKSISGGEVSPTRATPSRRPAAKLRETTSCNRLVGSWMFSNGIGVVFKSGGGLSSTNGDGGKWTCEGGMVAAHWAKWTDHYLIAPDGAHLSGNSGLMNMALTATKD